MMCVECLFSNVWRMVTAVEYPGTGLSIAAILVGVFLIGLAIRIFAYIFGFTIQATNSASSAKHLIPPKKTGEIGFRDK